MKTKILYCITKSVWGGAGKYVLELATALPKNDFDATVVLGGTGILTQALDSAGIRAISLPSLERDISFSKDFQVFKELLATFKKEKPDIVHLNSSKIGGLGALAGRIAGVPKIIFTAHGWAFNENRNLPSKVAIWLASWMTVLLSTKTIVINSRDLKQAKHFPFCGKKVELIYNGVKKTEAITTKENATQLLINLVAKIYPTHSLKNKEIIGNIAELHKNKGIIYALKAISKLPKIILDKIVFVVFGDGEERNDLELFVKNNDLQKNVVFIGFDDTVLACISAFDIFIFPSIKEGLPYAILEAGLAKLPVIATNVGGIPDIIENEKNGLLVPSKNPEEIKVALIELIGNKEKAKRLGEELHKKIISDFGFDKMLQKTIEVYKV